MPPATDAVFSSEMLEDHIGILGKTGSGKSNLAKVTVEMLLDTGQRVCVIDPTGSWYGLRLMPDLSPSPYNAVIFGGQHADVQISAAHGASIAEIVSTSSTPAIIDTQTMTVGARTQFFRDFAETLFIKNRGPLHLVIDEAHLFAPQGRVSDIKSGEMLHAANNLASLGRGRGIRIMFLSQRPAKLHKDSLTQIETLAAMRLIAPQDVGAVKDWIKESASIEQGADIISSLPSLPKGEGWLWSPALGVLERFKAPLVRTLDTGRPSDEQYELVPIDVSVVSDQLAQIAEESKANDPRLLKARIAELERAGRVVEKSVEKVVYVDRLGDDHQREIEAAIEVIREHAGLVDNAARQISSIIESAKLRAQPHEAKPAEPVAQGRPRDVPMRSVRPAGPSDTPPGAVAHAAAAPAGSNPTRYALRLIEALASRHPMVLTRSQLALFSRSSPKSSGFDLAIGELRRNGWIEPGPEFKLSAAGWDLLASRGWQPIAHAASEEQLWRNALPANALALFDAMVRHQQPVTRDELAELAQRSRTSSGFDLGVSILRKHDLLRTDGDGRLYLRELR